MVLPTEIRHEIASWGKDRAEADRGLVIAAPSHGLWLMFPEDFAALRDEAIAAHPRMSPAWLDAGHAFAVADRVAVDAAGRLQIPIAFRDEAEIDQDVAIVVVQGRVELWNPTRWRDRRALAKRRLLGEDTA